MATKKRKRTPQVFAVEQGICRVCRCVDERACPAGCSWMDPEHTICSACAAPFLDGILAERTRQIAKWGNGMPRGGFAFLVAVLTEEVGEVAKAVIEGNRRELEVELVQVSAVCLRMAEYLKRGDELLEHNTPITSFKSSRRRR